MLKRLQLKEVFHGDGLLLMLDDLRDRRLQLEVRGVAGIGKVVGYPVRIDGISGYEI